MRRAVRVLGSVLALAVPSMAWAQDPPAGGGVQYQQETQLNFDEDVVTGQLVRPDSETVTALRGSKSSSLIKIRQDFIPELVDSVEKL